MKKLYSIILFLAASIILISCSNSKADSQTKKDGVNEEQVNQFSYNEDEVKQGLPETTVTWDRAEENFGSVKAGEVLETTFTLTNTGKNPLIITDAKSTCGCTVPTVEKNKPIQPGESTEIGVRFNTKGKKGKQHKPINIFANVEGGKTTANITADVEEAPSEEAK